MNKKSEAIKTVNGRLYYWCPNHIVNGKWDRMYVSNKPENNKMKEATMTTAEGTGGGCRKTRQRPLTSIKSQGSHVY